MNLVKGYLSNGPVDSDWKRRERKRKNEKII